MSPDIHKAAVLEATKGMTYAVGIAPRSGRRRASRGGKTYAESFSVRPVVITFNGEPRVAAMLINDARHAVAIEFGNKRIEAHKVFDRTARHLGRSGAARAAAAARMATGGRDDA